MRVDKFSLDFSNEYARSLLLSCSKMIYFNEPPCPIGHAPRTRSVSKRREDAEDTKKKEKIPGNRGAEKEPS
jgi:hypothetical protein